MKNYEKQTLIINRIQIDIIRRDYFSERRLRGDTVWRGNVQRTIVCDTRDTSLDAAESLTQNHVDVRATVNELTDYRGVIENDS